MSGSPSDPRACVVITTHNRPEYAQRAIESALAQTIAEIEVIVVDDNSVPPFELDCDDPRVRLLRNPRPGGVSRARNTGLAAARAPWITFLDDDDVLLPEMLERSLAAAEASDLPAPVAVNPAVLVLDVDGVDGTTLVPAAELPRGLDYFLERRGASGRAANSLVIPTDVLRSIGGWDPALESFQHDDLGLRLNAVASIQGVRDALYVMTTHRAARVSARTSAIPADMEHTLAKHPEAFARHRHAHAHFLGVTGYYHLKAGHWRDAIRWCVRAVRRNPFDRRLWFFLAAAFAGPHAAEAYRRLYPRDTSVPFGTLMRRRLVKYGRLVADRPRAVLAAPVASTTRAIVRGRVLPAAARPRSVLVLGVYRSINAGTIGQLVDEARSHAWEVRLWALDRSAATLATCTRGEGPGAKFPLLNELVRDCDLGDFEWVVFVDDDVVFAPRSGSLAALLAVAESARLDLVQPAHTELSHRDNEIGVRRPCSIARRTTYVEIGPIFAVRRPWIEKVVPFGPEHTMGWGLELEWYDLERAGARLGIVDSITVRHLRPVGREYRKDEQRTRLGSMVRERGLASLREIQRTVATWRPWQPTPPWPD